MSRDEDGTLAARFLRAREHAKHTRNYAAVEIGCGVSTLYDLERYLKVPKHPLILKAVMQYITKNERSKA